MSGGSTSTWSRRALVGGAAGSAVSLRATGGRAVWPAAAQTSPTPVAPLTIAAAFPNLSLPFYRHMLNYMTLAAAQLPGVTVVPIDGQVNGSASATVQAAGLADALAAGADGLVVSPVAGPDLRLAVASYLQASVPVVMLEGEVPDFPVLASVGVDDIAGGRLQGDMLRAALPAGGKVFEIQGTIGTATSTGRHAGFRQRMREAPDLEIVASPSGGYAWGRAAIVFNAALEVHGAPDAVVCANDAMALGIAHIATEVGIAPIIIGFDALPETLIVIKDGLMYGTIEPFAGRQAQLALTTLVGAVRGHAAPVPATQDVTPIPITAANLGVAERSQEISGGGLLVDPLLEAALEAVTGPGTPVATPGGGPTGTPVRGPAATPEATGAGRAGGAHG